MVLAFDTRDKLSIADVAITNFEMPKGIGSEQCIAQIKSNKTEIGKGAISKGKNHRKQQRIVKPANKQSKNL